MQKPSTKEERLIEKYKKYNSIRNTLIELCELNDEKELEYLEAIELIDLGLGLFGTRFSFEKEGILDKLAAFKGDKLINNGEDTIRIFDSRQLSTIQLIKSLEKNYEKAEPKHSK